MNAESLRSLLRSEPFVPVKLVTSSGRKHEVHHPDYLLLSPGGASCFYFHKDGEAFSVIDVASISEVLPLKKRQARRKGD